MKLSVSVPDDLWHSVATPGSSPSQTIQDALRHVALSRATSESRISDVSSKVADRLLYVQGDPLAKLVGDALKIRDQGYGIGIEVGRELPWVDLELLPSGPELKAALFAALDDPAIPDMLHGLRDRWWQAVSEWEVDLAVDELGDPIPSRQLCEGIADGLDDLRNAVLARLQGTSATEEGNP